MAFQFLSLPIEIRLQVYSLLLKDFSIQIQYLFVRQNFQSAFRNKSPCTNIHPQILRTCRQTHSEGSPILYGSPHFDCSSCILGLEKLRAQIGPYNFRLIKRLTIDPIDLGDVASELEKRDASHSFYRNLESLSTTAHGIVDLSQPGWALPDIDIDEMSKLSLSARRIFQSHSLLQVLGQDSREDPRSWGDAIDASNNRVKWRFVRSRADLKANEYEADFEQLLYLASVILQSSTESLATRVGIMPEPLLTGLRAIMYP